MDKETGKWVPVCRTKPDVTDCPVKGLQEGHEYLFRVKAITEEGESEPLVADKDIKAKDRFGNCRACPTSGRPCRQAASRQVIIASSGNYQLGQHAEGTHTGAARIIFTQQVSNASFPFAFS